MSSARDVTLSLVAIAWNDIEILRVIDEAEQGEGVTLQNGTALMQAVAARRNLMPTSQDYPSFVRLPD